MSEKPKKPRRNSPKTERILDLYAQGYEYHEIVTMVGLNSHKAARALVHLARKAGDPRAMLKKDRDEKLGLTGGF